MIKNFKLTIEYDGSNYHGWQRQKSEPTVQEAIEQAVQIMTSQTISLIGSGRTDAGVHALGQTANFKCDTHLCPDTLQKGLNSLLGSDIVITSCQEVPLNFHARFDVKNKIYCYRISNSAIPPAIGRQYVWHVRKKLDLSTMETASAMLVGKKDFKSFEGAGSPRAHTIRTVINAGFTTGKNGILSFSIDADGFLRFMVRNIVGTLVDVGMGKISPEDFKTIVSAKNRTLAGATAPPQGLFLVEVNY